MRPGDKAAVSFVAWLAAGAVVDVYLVRTAVPWSTWIREDWPTPAKAGLAVAGTYLVVHVCWQLRFDPLSAVGRVLVKGVS